jgi:hypothetical protein
VVVAVLPSAVAVLVLADSEQHLVFLYLLLLL